MHYFWEANHFTKIFCFCVHSGALDVIYAGTSLYERIWWMHLEKKRTYPCTFPVQRKEINVVKVRFTMRYSSRKLSHEKVITTACNFWRQIACSFLVKSGNVLLLDKKKKKDWNPAIFSNPVRESGQKSSGMLITFFRPEMWKGEEIIKKSVFTEFTSRYHS